MTAPETVLKGKAAGLFLVIGYISAVSIPMIAASVYATSRQNVIYELGRNLALLGYMIIMIQVVLAARIRWTERPLGLDIILRYHRNMGIFAVGVFLAHPLFLAAGSGSAGLIFDVYVPWYIWLGRAAIAILAANVILSMYQGPLNLKFEKWRGIHDVLGPAVIGSAFVHSLAVGNDLGSGSMKLIWTLITVSAVILFLYHRIVRPVLLKRHPYKVIGVQPEAGDVWTIKLAPAQGRKINEYLPGQFHFITFFRNRGLPVEEHHWTISSSPANKDYISSTIKVLGDFTATMGETRVGDTASIHGPFGRFSYLLHPEEKDLVFIAGGIGITPLMSMLRSMRDVKDERKVLLLYANKQEDQIVFREELSTIEAGRYPLLEVVHVLSSPGKEWEGKTGYIDLERIRKHCKGDLDLKAFYICGPTGMIKAVTSALQNLGVKDGQIRIEIFAFLD